MRKLVIFPLGFLIFATGIFLLGPRPDNDESISFRPHMIGDNPAAYLAAAEAGIANLIPGSEKEIIWADPSTKSKTPIALVYVHGFSATKMETRPVPDNVAKALGANLYFTRLTGHGADGMALAKAKMNDWLNDLAEAIAIAEHLGEKIVLLSASTGATLSVLGTKQPALMKKVVGLAMISPNFAIHGASIAMMNMPWAENILPAIVGQEREWQPLNAEHGKWWTTKYPSQAVFPMAALMRQVEEVDKSSITTPALFIYSDNDKVVIPAETELVIRNWGGPTDVLKVTDTDDPSHHVIAGDILSPSTTLAVSRKIIEWIKGLRPR